MSHGLKRLDAHGKDPNENQDTRSTYLRHEISQSTPDFRAMMLGGVGTGTGCGSSGRSPATADLPRTPPQNRHRTSLPPPLSARASSACGRSKSCPRNRALEIVGKDLAIALDLVQHFLSSARCARFEEQLIRQRPKCATRKWPMGKLQLCFSK